MTDMVLGKLFQFGNSHKKSSVFTGIEQSMLQYFFIIMIDKIYYVIYYADLKIN